MQTPSPPTDTKKTICFEKIFSLSVPTRHLFLPLPTGTLTLTLHRCNLSAVRAARRVISYSEPVAGELPPPHERSN